MGLLQLWWVGASLSCGAWTSCVVSMRSKARASVAVAGRLSSWGAHLMVGIFPARIKPTFLVAGGFFTCSITRETPLLLFEELLPTSSDSLLQHIDMVSSAFGLAVTPWGFGGNEIERVIRLYLGSPFKFCVFTLQPLRNGGKKGRKGSTCVKSPSLTALCQLSGNLSLLWVIFKD